MSILFNVFILQFAYAGLIEIFPQTLHGVLKEKRIAHLNFKIHHSEMVQAIK
jgi:hypothetical protein